MQCGSSSPGLHCDWQNNYSLCGPCESLSRCPLCQRQYTHDDLILQCQHCDRYTHTHDISSVNQIIFMRHLWNKSSLHPSQMVWLVVRGCGLLIHCFNLCVWGYVCVPARRWVHAMCQGLTTEDEVETAADEGFDCSLCRTHSRGSFGENCCGNIRLRMEASDWLRNMCV